MADQEVKLKITSDASAAINEIKKFTHSLQATSVTASSISATLRSSWGGIAATMAIPLSIGGLASFVKSTLEAKDRLDETAQKAGIAATSLQLYEYSAKLAGVSSDALVTGIGILSRNMMGAADDIGGAAKSFDALGLSTTDASGNLKSAEDMIAEIADKFAGMNDGVGKTALAMSLFGRSGKELIPFLNQGSAGLEEVKQRMIALGYSFDENGIKRAAEVNDRLDEMGSALKKVAERVVMNMLPELENMSEKMIKAAEDTDGFKDATDSLTTGIKLMSHFALGVAAAFDIMGTSIGEAFARGQKAYEDSSWISKMTGIASIKAGIIGFTGGKNDQNSALNQKIEMWGGLMEGIWSDPSATGPTSHTPSRGGAPRIGGDAKSIEDMANAQRQWQQSIAALNPYLTDEAKRIQHLIDQAENLREKYGDKGWIKKGLEQGKAYLAQAAQIKSEEESQRFEAEMSAGAIKIMNDRLQKELDLKLMLIDADTQRNVLALEYSRRALDIGARYGSITQGQAAGSAFDMDVRRLEITKQALALQIQAHSELAIEEQENTGILKLLLQQKAVQEEINMLLGLRTAVLKEHEGTYAEGMATGWKKYMDSIGSEFQRGEQMAQDLAKTMHGTLEEFFFDPMKFSWENLWNSLRRIAAKSMADMVMDWFKAQMKMSSGGGSGGLFGMFSGLFGGGGGQNIGLGNTVDEFSFHQGGPVLRGFGGGPVPRMHRGGLMSDEVPAILQTGEYVMSRKQVAAMKSGGGGGGTTVNNVTINATDAQSFTNMLRANPNAIADAVVTAGRSRHPARRRR